MHGRDFDTTKTSQLVRGRTTSAEVTYLFGTPFSKKPEGEDSEMWTYSYTDVTAHAQAVPFGGTTAIATGFKKNLYIVINHSGVVKNFTLDEGPLDARIDKS